MPPEIGGVRHHRPEAVANGGERIAEAGLVFGVPSSASSEAITVELGLGPERHQRKQAEQHRRGARDGQLGPLPLGFDTEMPAYFRERHFDRPAPHEPVEHVERIDIRVSTEEALRLELARNVAH